jgi:tetratricopeptide (TPR) repeat protein
MLAKKNRTGSAALVLLLVLTVFLAGCTPPGPRALLKGKKLLDRGDYAGAVEQFKTATSLLPTNAQAWNYLGVACQRAGQPADAASAYQRALTLDRDLVEAHYNLGSLWLEQDKPADARTEFTAYTLRRSNEPDGWLKLGLAQLHSNDLLSSEKSFSTALHLSTNSAEALNGLGLARAKRGRAADAVQFFTAAIRYHPEFAPAYLNLATIAHEDLHDNKLALENYQAYLALTPRPADWDAVSQIVKNLEPQTSVAAVAAKTTAQPPPAVDKSTATTESKPQPTIRSAAPPKQATTTRRVVTAPLRNVSAPPPDEVTVEPPPRIEAKEEKPVVETPARPAPPILTSIPRTPPQKYVDTGITPLPPAGSKTVTKAGAEATQQPPNESKPAPTAPPPAPVFPRYAYQSLRQPSPGSRISASAAFTKAQTFEQNSRWTDAMKAYRQAATLDPSWFEAEYNCAAMAYRSGDVSTALSAYERALAIEPDSTNARYNFALALKAGGYMLDAVNELKKMAATNPRDARLQLALGNLYAQELREPAFAREHYLKVLELEPHNSEANNIRFWLSANPPETK